MYKYENIGVHIAQREKKYFLILYTFIPEKLSAEHTGSAFIQHYYIFFNMYQSFLHVFGDGDVSI